MSSRTASRNAQSRNSVSRTGSRKQDRASRMSRRDRHRESPDDVKLDDDDIKSRNGEKGENIEETHSRNYTPKSRISQRDRHRESPDDGKLDDDVIKSRNGEKGENKKETHQRNYSPKPGTSRGHSGSSDRGRHGRDDEKDQERIADSRNTNSKTDKRQRELSRDREWSIERKAESRLQNDGTVSDVRLVKLADSAERYDHMSELMMTHTKQRKYLNSEERELLWLSFRNRIKPYRKSWRVVSSEIDSPSGEKEYKAMVEKLKTSIEKEVKEFCENFLSLLNDTLIPNIDKNRTSADDTTEAEIFYNKLKGDSYRYLWELYDRDKNKLRQKYSDLAKVAYVTANNDAEKYLGNAHPLRLGIVLNYSVLLYEVLGDTEKAKEIAKDAIHKADKDLDRLEDKHKQDASSIIGMIEENLDMWKI